MLIEKEIIAPGQYWYTDKAGLPRKIDVTSDWTKYWHEQGSKMLSSGLVVPVPYEHDFNAKPTPKTKRDELLGIAGEVKEYVLKDFDDPKRGKVKDALFGVVEIQDPDAKKKIGQSIKWTSPWISSFTDGDGKTWNNVISHLALTARPRVIKQAPFPSIAAALSMASVVRPTPAVPVGKDGFCITRACTLVEKKGRLRPLYPIAFSMMSGVALGEDDMPPPKEKKKDPKAPRQDDTGSKDKGGDSDGKDAGGSGGGGNDSPSKGKDGGDNDNDGEDFTDTMSDEDRSFADRAGDVGMEQILCDLLGALGIHVECGTGEAGFKRALYNAAMMKIHELTAKAQEPETSMSKPNPTSPSGAAGPHDVRPEQQPMYMSLSLEDIHKLPEPLRGPVLSMYGENQKLRADIDTNTKVVNSLRDSKIKEETERRTKRIEAIGRTSPKAKADLEAMAAMPAMAMSIGDGGTVVDPMASMLNILEKSLTEMPRLLVTDSAALSSQPQPTDGDLLTEERAISISDTMARMMGCMPEKAAS